MKKGDWEIGELFGADFPNGFLVLNREGGGFELGVARGGEGIFISI